ncbi:hypothetical protein [Rossellomorea arthrocnemi]|jgi:hypothetical protein|uniref:hypothetical protein n=1 Tax=Rossellomorea arthrocnemi TaxID=2769542 RepID=UPI00191AF324|nr:hypothetical protein [Rossellomorea arthrocnemi]
MSYPTKEEINKVDNHLTELRLENFIHDDLLSPQWWLLLALLIIPWIVWWILVDKSRIKQIWLFGVFIYPCHLFRRYRQRVEFMELPDKTN